MSDSAAPVRFEYRIRMHNGEWSRWDGENAMGDPYTRETRDYLAAGVDRAMVETRDLFTHPIPVTVTKSMSALHDVLRGLRARNHPDALVMTNALADLNVVPATVDERITVAWKTLNRYVTHRNDDEMQCREYRDGPDTCDCGLAEAYAEMLVALGSKT